MITKIFGAVSRFKKEESGAAMVEYAVALLVVTAIGIGTMSILGASAGTITQDACTDLQANAVTVVAGTC